MIKFEKYTLDNGLKIITHVDNSTPLATVNLLYKVGAKHENPEKTGFAHLFEHLMFGGSENVKNFDNHIQNIGAESNAFTNNDITNYYISLPSVNIETAFWLEADRMNCLAFTPKSLEVQRSVVIEEYRQRYLNQPYGDIWLLLRPLAYKVHPYQWPTIGKDISHIEQATMDEVKDFFFGFYAPNNAILTVSGDIDTDEIFKLADKWFGQIERRNIRPKNYNDEPKQTEYRELIVERDVPVDAFFKAYHIRHRLSREYYVADMITDILSSGKSSRLYQKLVIEQSYFTEIDSFITGTLDNGLLIVTGKPAEGISLEEAERAADNEINKLKNNAVEEYELQKHKNKFEANMLFSEIKNINKAMMLTYFELLGDAHMIDTEFAKYGSISKNEIMQTANEIIKPQNCSTLYYKSVK